MSLQIESNREAIKNEQASDSASLDQAYFPDYNAVAGKDALQREDVQDRATRVVRPVGPAGEAYVFIDPATSQDSASEVYQNGERAYRIAIAEGMDPETADKSRWEAMIRTSSVFSEKTQAKTTEEEPKENIPEEKTKEPISASTPRELSATQEDPLLSVNGNATIEVGQRPLEYLQHRILAMPQESVIASNVTYGSWREEMQRSLAHQGEIEFSWSINPPNLAV